MTYDKIDNIDVELVRRRHCSRVGSLFIRRRDIVKFDVAEYHHFFFCQQNIDRGDTEKSDQ